MKTNLSDMDLLRNEYRYRFDPFNENLRGQHILMLCEELSDYDQRLVYLYAETNSCRQVGKELGVSHTAVAKRMKKIRKIFSSDISAGYENSLQKKRRLS